MFKSSLWDKFIKFWRLKNGFILHNQTDAAFVYLIYFISAVGTQASNVSWALLDLEDLSDLTKPNWRCSFCHVYIRVVIAQVSDVSWVLLDFENFSDLIKPNCRCSILSCIYLLSVVIAQLNNVSWVLLSFRDSVMD